MARVACDELAWRRHKVNRSAWNLLFGGVFGQEKCVNLFIAMTWCTHKGTDAINGKCHTLTASNRCWHEWLDREKRTRNTESERLLTLSIWFVNACKHFYVFRHKRNWTEQSEFCHGDDNMMKSMKMNFYVMNAGARHILHTLNAFGIGISQSAHIPRIALTRQFRLPQ